VNGFQSFGLTFFFYIGSSAPVTVNIGSLCVVPEISLVGNFLVASDGATSYQWFNEALPIEGATTRFLELNLTAFGNYTVQTGSGSCTQTSLPFTFIITSLDGLADGVKPVIFPVPFDQELSIANLTAWSGAQLELWGINGTRHAQTIIEKESGSTVTFPTHGLGPGIYILMLRQGKYIYTKRVIKN
jgi:hypothetical protein